MLTLSTAFTGKHYIAQDTQMTRALDACIAEWEPYYLKRLFGVALYTLFDADTAPYEDRFTAIRNAFDTQDDSDNFYKSAGLLSMLRSLIYAEFILTAETMLTPAGLVRINGEATERLPKWPKACVMHNEGVETWRAIQWYMTTSDAAADYPEFTGIDETLWARHNQ